MANNERPLTLLFVCLGNICRSTMAEGVFHHLLQNTPSSLSSSQKSQLSRISQIDSAGTGGYHIGAPPDSRTMSVLRKHDITTYTHGARQIELADFVRFDYIFGMDRDNVGDLREERERAVALAKRIKEGGNTNNKTTTNLDGGTSKRASRRTREEDEFTAAYRKAEDEGLLAARGGGEDGLGQVFLYGAFGGKRENEEVNDPYYGGNKGFDVAFEQLERFGKGFLGYSAEKEGS